MKNSSKHVIIIGAGPSGIASTVFLRKNNVKYTLLEQSSSAFGALRRIDSNMRLVSPTRLSLLPEMRLKQGSLKYLTFKDIKEEFQQYFERNKMEASTSVKVVSVNRKLKDFIVECRNRGGTTGNIIGSHVINATGVISFPRFPDNFDTGLCSIKSRHSIDVREQDIAGSRRLLVVGGGISAMETLEKWLEIRQPGDQAWMSLRSKLRSVRNPILGIDVHYFIWLPEQLPSWIIGSLSSKIRDPMIGTKITNAVKKKIIFTRPAAIKYNGNGITFQDGQKLEPDLVVFATGFKYETKHLNGLIDYDDTGRPIVNSCESSRTPGLYLLGLRYGRTFASPFLRGIGRDAKYVVKRIVSSN